MRYSGKLLAINCPSADRMFPRVGFTMTSSLTKRAATSSQYPRSANIRKPARIIMEMATIIIMATMARYRVDVLFLKSICINYNHQFIL